MRLRQSNANWVRQLSLLSPSPLSSSLFSSQSLGANTLFTIFRTTFNGLARCFLTRVHCLRRLASTPAPTLPYLATEALSTSQRPSVSVCVCVFFGALLLTLIAALTYFAAVAFLHLALMCFDAIPATVSCTEVPPLPPPHPSPRLNLACKRTSFAIFARLFAACRPKCAMAQVRDDRGDLFCLPAASCIAEHIPERGRGVGWGRLSPTL